MSGLANATRERGLLAPRAGNAKALLRELLRLLDDLAAGGTGGSIDLMSMPFAQADYEEMRDVLGVGAIDARLEALGESRVQETRYPGIWWVRHCNEDRETVAELIEVVSAKDLEFKSRRSLAVKPMYRVTDEKYAVYWGTEKKV